MSISAIKRLTAFLAASMLSACSGPSEPDPVATERIATAKLDRVEAILSERADHHAVTAASITVLSGSAPARTYRIGEAQTQTQGLMQAASLSKAVAAAGILTLMEREGIDIDADIRSLFDTIEIGLIPGGDQPLSMRALLSHTAGATQSGYPGYRRGSDLPSSTAIITDPPSRVVSAVELSLPRGEFSYAGGGYQIAQVLAEDISGQPFAELMRTMILDPLGMTASTFMQPIDPDAVAPLTIIPADSPRRIREGLFRPLENDWFDYPEQAAAGLWTTSTDYARFVDALLDAASGRPSPLSPRIAKAMLTPVAATNFGDADLMYGLGVALRVDAQDHVVLVRHSGLNAGYRALFSAEPIGERIVISLTNAPGGAAFNEEVVQGLLQNPGFTQP